MVSVVVQEVPQWYKQSPHITWRPIVTLGCPVVSVLVLRESEMKI